jgi:Phage integrase family
MMRAHKTRRTAGQRVRDATGNLKAVQKLLGHSSIQTTGDIYADWDVHQLASTIAEVLAGDHLPLQSLRLALPKGQCLSEMETVGIEPTSAIA